MATTHTIHSHQHHNVWNNSLPPILTISPGDTVTLDCQDCSGGQITPSSTSTDLPAINFSTLNPIFGPIHILDASPGDVLEVEILSLQTRTWGFTLIFPGFGLLPSQFPSPVLKIWDQIPERDFEPIYFNERIRVPKRPFLGIMGVAPGADGDHGTIPPLASGEGGNVDCRGLVVGTKVLFPVRVGGALFSCGDGHAAQGDGEVCGSAVETGVKATLRFRVRKGEPWVKSVCFESKAEGKREEERGVFADKGRYSVMGVDADMVEATRKATRGMIEWLVGTKGLSEVDAYMLCSVAMDLKLAEVVDINYNVVASVELNIFVEDGRKGA